ncbi:MAG: hypothetical protein IJ341_01830 [Bacteroidales bacterium]|nr:hypothetical protein [Bacteroidales bacterium]
MKNTFTHKNLIALMLVVIITITSVYMAGCSDSEQIPTVPATASVATIDEATVNTEATTQTATRNNTTVAMTTTTSAEMNTEANATAASKAEVGENTQETHAPNEETVVSQGDATPGHSHSYTAKVTKATCGSEGYTTYTCKCGASYVGDYTYALKHNWGGWTTVKEATTEAEGEQESVCTRCGYVKTQKIDKLSSPYDADPRSNPELLRERILYYINEYRDTPATSLPRMTQVADYRAVQLENNFDHDVDDKREAYNAYKYGDYNVYEDSIYNPETGGITYTGEKIEEYRNIYTWEAIGKSSYSNNIDKLANRIATMFYNSSGHWSYVGDSTNIYISVGVHISGQSVYTCVLAAPSEVAKYE